MKKFFSVVLFMSSMTSFAGTTATLLLKGTIQELLDISVNADAAASSLDLTTTQSSTRVARVTEKSNSNTGYKVTISSANLGKLKNGSELFTYTLSYDGVALNLASPVVQNHSAATAVTVQKDVNISYTGVPQDQLVAGDYTDTITFTIAAN